ncbi:LOW QUALITY PROTEIN: UPF0686 protein C11orf1 homolog [Aquila chrysaetos chrysaetos]|uniref:LOW QUALITY PROTEIN: UPF0686 protein C11orf1 homolog n=1 Tax=Aquila chrysaetos chrysaetos TaxID=223781 RepID=UPI00117722D2|nr:LOW QUALITY PROTEIN: UPF0686 protein C11orf1 homolog [Aquila chrysaetos chrysaetos]
MTAEGLKLAKASCSRDLLPAVDEIMSKICLYNSLHGALMHAAGHEELWMDWDSTYKFSQYGWRCTTNGNDYSAKTLMGNWNEEQYNIQRIVQPKAPPSQDLNENLTGFRATTLSWNLLRSTQLLSPATQ